MLPSVTKKGADGPTTYSVTEPGAMQVPPQLPAGWAGAGARGLTMGVLGSGQHTQLPVT